MPVADGGEGTGEAFAAALGGEWREAVVSDPLGRPTPARWLLLPDGRAVVEAAAAIGLPLLAGEERNPLRASSRGLGELLLAVLRESPASVVVGLGGSATVDGGAGMRECMRELPVSTVVLCDVRTPLRDAARLFGPQKGASEEGVRELERRLDAMDELRPFADLEGSGAAGGLGAALAALGADLVPGAPTLLDLVGFDEALPGHDLVVTGEGQIDTTTAEGKAPEKLLAARRQVAFAASCSAAACARRFRERRRSHSRARRSTLRPIWSISVGTSPRRSAPCLARVRAEGRPTASRPSRGGRPSTRAASTRPAGATPRTVETRRRAARTP